MMNHKILVAATLLQFCLWGSGSVYSAQDSYIAGNGTDVLVCRGRRPDRAPSVELVDYFEARDMDDRDLPYRRRYANIEERLDEIFAQSLRLDPALTERFRTFAIQFLTLNDVQMSPHPLSDIEDSQLEVRPSRCERRQLIARRGPSRGRRKEFLVDQALWRRMGTVQKAGAILNLAFIEVMLERDEDADVSNPARIMNGLWADADHLQTLNVRDYLEEISQVAPFDAMANPFVNGRGAHPVIPASDFSRNALGRIGLPASRVGGTNFLPVPRMEGYGIPGDVTVWLSEQNIGQVDWDLTIAATPPRAPASGFAPIIFILGSYDVPRFVPLNATLEIQPANGGGGTWEQVEIHHPTPRSFWVPLLRQHVQPWDSIAAPDGRYRYRLTIDRNQTNFSQTTEIYFGAKFLTGRRPQVIRPPAGAGGTARNITAALQGSPVVMRGEFTRTAAGLSAVTASY